MILMKNIHTCTTKGWTERPRDVKKIRKRVIKKVNQALSVKISNNDDDDDVDDDD